MRAKLLWLWLIGCLWVISACVRGPAAPAGTATASGTLAPRILPAWMQYDLVDGRGGELFKVGDLNATIFVIIMAQDCPECEQQRREMAAAHQRLMGTGRFLLSIDIDRELGISNMADAMLAQGYGWVFTIITKDVSDALVLSYGQDILDAQRLPHFVVDANGKATPLAFGLVTADEIVRMVNGG
jgi:hypothetical protein